jgi:hypothetical protein
LAKRAKCSLFFLFARAAAVGIVFRRGPTDWTQIQKWDTKHDKFQPGQWFHGTMFVRRSDLSPDGKLLVYFAAKYGRPKNYAGYTETWTAVSKPPWLTALALWPKDDAWGGGGLFTGNKMLQLNHREAKAHADHEPGRHLGVHAVYYRGEDSPLFERRLLRDGSTLEQQGSWRNIERNGWKPRADPPAVWSKPNPTEDFSLLRNLHGYHENRRGVSRTYIETFSLRRAGKTNSIILPDADWADWDQAGRLIIARAGRLIAVHITAKGALHEKVIADFTFEKPTPIESPPEAKTW